MPWIHQLLLRLQHILVWIFSGKESALSMAMRSFLLINIEASVINFFTAGHDSSLLRRWTLAFGKMNDIFSHESVGLSWNWYLNLLLVLVDLLILLLKRLLKLHILVIHLMHLLLFTSKNRVLRGRENLIWTTLHGIGVWSWVGSSTSLELLAHFLGMNISHVIRKALCFDAVYRRIVLTMEVWIWHTLMLSILVRITQVLNVLGPIWLNVCHFSKQFLFTGNIVQNLHFMINHHRVIVLHVKTLSLRIFGALNATILWLLLCLHLWWLLLDIRTRCSWVSMLAPIQRLYASALVRQVCCHRSSMLSSTLPLLLELLLALSERSLDLLLLWNSHVWSKSVSLILYLRILLMARELTFSGNRAIWTLVLIYTGLGIRVHNINLGIRWLHVLVILLLLMKWIKIGADMECWLWSNLLLLVDWYLMIKLLQKHLWVFENALTFLEFRTNSDTWSSVSISIRLATFFYASCMDQRLILSKGGQLVVIIIPVEKRLDTVSSKISEVLFEFWILEVFPFFIDIFLVKIVLEWWDKRSSHPLFVEVLPWEI